MSTLDLRPLVPAKRHQLIFERLDALAPGESLELVNDHKPSPLRYQLEATRAGQYDWEDGEAGPERFTATITCQARIVDARPLIAAGEEPFGTIMQAVDGLADDQVLVVIAPFEPVPLEGVLGGQGFTHEVEELDSGDWRVAFRRAS